MGDLEKQFDAEMMSIYSRALSETGYRASAFHQMLVERRGVATAKTLINAPKPSDGYRRLFELKRLDLSVEATVLATPKWAPLFTPDEILKAKRRLKEYGYKVE